MLCNFYGFCYLCFSFVDFLVFHLGFWFKNLGIRFFIMCSFHLHYSWLALFMVLTFVNLNWRHFCQTFDSFLVFLVFLYRTWGGFDFWNILFLTLCEDWGVKWFAGFIVFFEWFWHFVLPIVLSLVTSSVCFLFCLLDWLVYYES